MNFEYVCRQFELGELMSVTPLAPGTAARVWQLNTERGAFLLRTLPSREQGEREWAAVCHLHSRGFWDVPSIAVPCVELDGNWYQVQELLPGTMPDPAEPGVARAMANVAKRLTESMPKGMIHGDLGPWNLLQGEAGKVSVIDFGEIRPGDPYFDYATLLGGVINHTPPELRENICREFLAELDCDRSKLLEQLRLWAEQGIRQWTGRSEKMVSRFHHAMNWAEENLYEL